MNDKIAAPMTAKPDLPALPEAELAACKEDAARLDWLETRSRDFGSVTVGEVLEKGCRCLCCWEFGVTDEDEKLGRGENIRAAIDAARQSTAPGDGFVAVEWRWVDERGRAMTEWAAGDPPPMDAVSDSKGTMRVEVRIRPAPPTKENSDEQR